MNKAELITAIAKKTKLSKKDTQATIEAFTDVVTKTLKKKDKVTLIGFGSWEVVKRKARTGRNPQTGKEIKIAAKSVPKFKPGKALKDSIK